ncbi:unnamed protein product, partial [Chrysoparadoxa australica]
KGDPGDVGPQGPQGPPGVDSSIEECFAIINANGTIRKQSGTISLVCVRTGTGRYSFTFATALLDSDYFISVNNEEGVTTRDDVKAFYYSRTAVGFSVWCGEQDNGGTAGVDRDRELMIHIRKL